MGKDDNVDLFKQYVFDWKEVINTR